MARSALSLAALLLVLLSPAAAQGKAADRNRNDVPDRWEKAHGLSVKKDEAGRDRDRDGLANRSEWAGGTDPRRRDSDGDRRPDGREDADRDGLTAAQEQRFGFHPRKRDSDLDGIRDGRENAGVVTAADGVSITIALATGRTLTARIDDLAEIGCDGGELAGEDVVPPAGFGEDDSEIGDDGPEGDEDVLDDEDTAEDDEAADEIARLAQDDAVDPEDVCAATIRRGAVVHSASIRLENGAAVLETIEFF